MWNELPVAAVAVDSRPGDVERNFEKIARWTERAASEGARLVLFPELSLSGFIPNHPIGDHETWLKTALLECRRAALRVDAAPVQALGELAARQRVAISVGMLEDAGNLLYDSQVLATPDGGIHVTRKMHVPMFEMPFYNPGPAPSVVETSGVRVGTNICFDALLPESTRLLAVQNVEVVLFPFAADPPPRTPAGWAAWAGPALRARCQENGAFGIAVNYVGDVECAGAQQSFPGGGLVISPRGDLLAEWSEDTGQPGMLLATLRASDLQAARAEPEYLFRFRRPELYGPLAES